MSKIFSQSHTGNMGLSFKIQKRVSSISHPQTFSGNHCMESSPRIQRLIETTMGGISTQGSKRYSEARATNAPFFTKTGKDFAFGTKLTSNVKVTALLMSKHQSFYFMTLTVDRTANDGLPTVYCAKCLGQKHK